MAEMSDWLQAGNPGKNHTPWKAQPQGTYTKKQIRHLTNNMTGELLTRADTLSKRPYTPYEGERIAGISQNEQMASNLARDNVTSGRIQSYYDKASGSIDQANQDFSGENLAKYTNPYTEQVTNIALRNANQDFENQRSDLRSNLAASDAFGSDRGALMESELNRTHEQNVGDITVKGQSDAFDRATNLFQQDSSRHLAAAQAYENVGNDVTQLNASQMRDLLATGSIDRLLRQAQLDVNYSDFIDQRDWDVNNLQTLLSAVQASKGVAGQPQQKKNNGTWSTVLGAVGTVIGAYYGGTAGAQAGGAIGSAAGGAIDN